MPSCLWEHLEDLKIFTENRWLFDYLLRNAANLLSYYLKKYAKPPSKAKENQNLNLHRPLHLYRWLYQLSFIVDR